MVLFQVAGVPSRRAGYPLWIIPVPPILVRRGGLIFPTPGQQEGFSPSRLEFFHSFYDRGTSSLASRAAPRAPIIWGSGGTKRVTLSRSSKARTTPSFLATPPVRVTSLSSPTR